MEYDTISSALNLLFAISAISLGSGVAWMYFRRSVPADSRRTVQQLCPIGRANAVREDRC